MSVSIRDVQSKILSSGILNTLGSEKLNDLPYDSIVEEIVELWAEKSFIPAVKDSITKKKLNASKDLLQSVAPDIVTKGNNIVRFRLLMADHWQFAEQGRKAGKRPPIKAIEQWITFKGIKVRDSPADSKLSVLQKRRAMATGIARAIGRRGTIKRFNYKGSDFLSSITPTQMKILGEMVSKAVGFTVQVEFQTVMRKAQKRK